MYLNLSDEEKQLAVKAKDYVKKDMALLEKFATAVPIDENPTSIFMAGSPGAGKTEASKRLAKSLQEEVGKQVILRIDPDEIRDLLPWYDGSNAYVFGEACTKGVELLHDHALHKSKSFILDGTFHNYGKQHDNLTRSFGRNRAVAILYVYQPPIDAWEFTKVREAEEGRRVPKEYFIDAFLGAQDSVSRLKKAFPKKVQLWYLQPDPNGRGIGRIEFDVSSIDPLLDKKYTKTELKDILR